MRINKYIADAGICSRRKADELISNGNVKINGLTVKELGVDVAEGDVVEVNGSVIEAGRRKVYVAVNKPAGVITGNGKRWRTLSPTYRKDCFRLAGWIITLQGFLS